MYETFFGLKRQPFLFAPDVESYFSVDFMEESRETVEQAVRKGEGISLIFGATGTGKTLLMRILRQSLESECTALLVSNSRLDTPRALFLQLAHDLNLSCSGSETIELRLQILDYVRKESPQGVVLLFDEAQHLDPSVLEEIRLLTDAANDSAPFFRAILAGTLDFEEKLTFPKLEGFNQRVVSRSYLDSFTGEETSRYVVRQTENLRIDPAHGTPVPLFSESAKRRIHQLTGGIPRVINQLCGTALQFAAEKAKENVDEALINDAWASLQHIEPIEAEVTASTTALESVIPPEQIEEILDKKRQTFRIRPFVDSVEFGTLSDSEPLSERLPQPEPVGMSPSFLGNDYKPLYPEYDDDFVELESEISETTDEVVSSYRVLQIHVPTDTEEPGAELAIRNAESVAISTHRIVSNLYEQERKFRRQYLLQKIQHRLGVFAGLLQKSETQQTESPNNESEMDVRILQAYGAAVLEGRPPFIRKEPHYAYQTQEMPPQQDVTYPDPKTGVPISLRWFTEKTAEGERFGVSYTEFLNRDKTPEPVASEETTEQLQPVAVLPEPAEVPTVRTSLNASLANPVEPSHSLGLEETFEESHRVGHLAISLAELFRAKSSALRQTETSPEFSGLDESIQRQLEAVVKRIIKAAEKIEQAAEVSEQAGRHVSKTAEFVETEVKAALPVYTDLFQQWSEFQELISSEVASLRQRDSGMPKLRTIAHRQVMIERSLPTIDVEMLLR